MKKSILSSLIAMAMVSPTIATAQDAPVPHREFWCYYFFNNNFVTYNAMGQLVAHHGYSMQYLDEPDQAELKHDFAQYAQRAIYAGTAVDGVFYGCEYQYFLDYNPPIPTAVVVYNSATGEMERLSNWAPVDSYFKPQDLTYDYNEKVFYATGYELGQTALYTFDPYGPRENKFKKVCNLPETCPVLACDKNSNIYAITGTGRFVKINKANGNLTEIFDTGLGHLVRNQSMEFDQTTGNFYWAAQTDKNVPGGGGEDCELYEIVVRNDKKETMNLLGIYGDEASILSIYMPYAADMKAPGKLENINIAPAADGSLSATLTWTNPTKTFDGTELSEIQGVAIERDGEFQAYVSTTEPGATVTWTDNKITESAYYKYTLIAVNSKGDGQKTFAYRLVGNDRPAAVTGLGCEYLDDCASVKLTWEPVTKGYYDGVFNPADVRYRVTRYPDEAVVADNMTECEFVDRNIRRLAKYTYEVSAYNNYGETVAVTQGLTAGPAQELPLVGDFSVKTELDNWWTFVDANDDDFSWTFNNITYGNMVFGNTRSGAEYIVTPLNPVFADADEWIITPPLKFETGKQYEVTIDARSYTADNLEVYFGKECTVASMNKIGDFDIEYALGDDDVAQSMSSKFTLPTAGAEMVGCVGVHLTTPRPADNQQYLQIHNIDVAEKSASAITAPEANKVRVYCDGTTLHTVGVAGDVCVYDLTGVEVLRSKAADVKLNVAAGVYIVVVNGKDGSKHSQKIVVK